MDALEGLKPKQQNDPSIVLFVGLYLLLLAFFVLLNVMSTIDQQRVRMVIDSLSATFRSDFGPLASKPVYSSASEAPLVSNQFLSDIEQLLENAMPVDQVDVLVYGDMLEILLEADTLFIPGNAEIRPEHADLVRRLQEAAVSGLAGLGYNVGILMSSPPVSRHTLAAGQTLEMARAGTLARRMVEYGARPSTIYTAIETAKPGQLRLLFRIIGEGDGEILFRQSADTDKGG